MVIFTWHNPVTWIAIAFVAVWIAFHVRGMWQQEKRLRCLEHEMAAALHQTDRAPSLTGTEVHRRFDALSKDA